MPFLHNHKKPKVWWVSAYAATKKTGLQNTVYTVSRDVYVGEWANNVYQGKGRLITNHGTKVYEGDFNNHIREGYGTYAKLAKDKISHQLYYVGEWKNNKFHGNGTKYYYNDDGTSSMYIGNFVKGKRSGYGRMWYADCSYYDGDWENDLYNGFGMFVQTNGNRYEGEFKAGLKHGKGRFYHLNVGQLQEGLWIDDMCKVSTIIIIPFRQSALNPTEYPIPPVKLVDPEDIIKKSMEEHQKHK
ncbi:MORN repeat-containing protein 3-like [Chrysoperla carnea]|uniref:MORN repeat-containing protein 3-like n=1 Tax=Chrysoperla carnea TaxID=189513 RepID=UPI001D08324E|nr:MORN repeat-containing protein 3-like [Chrysoperla carnea]